MDTDVISLICAHCGAIFQRDKRNDTRGRRNGMRKFCSKTCLAKCRELPSIDRGIRLLLRESLKSGRKRAKMRNLNHELDLAYMREMWDTQKGLCAVTGVPLLFDNQNPLLRPSLDRIDSSIGYTHSNVRYVCRGINYLKMAYSDEDMRAALTLFAAGLDKVSDGL